MVPDRSGGFGPLGPACADPQTTGTKPPVSASDDALGLLV